MGLRTLLTLAVGGFLLFGVQVPASAAESDESTLWFEFENEDSAIEEHTAQMLWNLNTDNLDLERFPTMEGWNSNYLEVAETITGVITADLEGQSVAGTFAETWQCSGGCVDEQGVPYYPTTMDTGFRVTVQDGILIPDGPLWKVDAIASITYHADVTSDETPSDCGGEPCYTCLGRVCRFSETMTATADLEGWLDGDTLSLAFADRLEPDASQMDFTGLRDIQFFMSRFSITITGAVVPEVQAPPPDPELPEPNSDPTDADSANEDEPTDDNQAATPADDNQAATPPAGDNQAATPPAGDDQAATPPGDDNQAATPAKQDDWAFEFIFVLILLGLGLTGWVVLRKLEWFRPKSKPLPPPAPPVYPADTSRKTYVVDNQELTYRTTIEPVSTAYDTTHVLRNPQDPSKEITGTDDEGQHHKVQPGHEVSVLRRAGDYFEVRPPGQGSFWVDKYCVQPKPLPPNPR